MGTGQDLNNVAVFLAVSLGMSCLLAALSSYLRSDAARGVARLRQLAEAEQGNGGAGWVLSFLGKVGALLLPSRERQRVQLEARLIQAGIRTPGAASTFLGAKLVLVIVLPAVTALAVYASGRLTVERVLLAGAVAAGAGVIGPGLWLDHRRRKYQAELRRALPDALDLLVLCVEGGSTLSAAIRRVTEDLERTHPQLTAEMQIVQREMQLGLSAGESIRRFGDRCDLEDLRDLAAVLLQSERFGAGVAKALRGYADDCRLERQQRAEETAQRAAVKILFPTLLCIFPAIFIVLLGPAAYQMAAVLAKTR